jgi:hypothetical protein
MSFLLRQLLITCFEITYFQSDPFNYKQQHDGGGCGCHGGGDDYQQPIKLLPMYAQQVTVALCTLHRQYDSMTSSS